MDVEAESVTKLIFSEDIPEKWKENPDFYYYLSKLGSYSVDQLAKEPDRLADEKASVLTQTQELAFDNYKTFIQTAECSRAIFQQFNKTEESLECLVKGLPVLSAACEEFAHASSEIKTHRRLNSLTLTRNAQLLQVLEIPQLMDSCIRDGYFEEALQLASYVRRLGNKHSDIPIIENIVKEVEAAWWTLMHQLIAQLRCDLQLPRCLQVVGYLRRMEIFTEAELRLKFLQARDSWFQSLLAAIPTDDANQHLMRTIELSRIHLFNIITQYRAVFSDDESVLSSTKQHSLSDSTIFHSWIIDKVNQFINVLEQDLNKGVGSSLSSLLGQSMYFGLSFSRVGADFRALIAPIFVKTVINNFTSAVRKATKRFDVDMEKFTLPKILSSAHYSDLKEEKKITLKLEQQALSASEKEAFTRFCVCFAEDLLPYIQNCLHIIYKPADIAKYLGVTTFNLQEQKLTYLNQAEILDPINHLLPVKLPVLPVTNSSSERTKTVTDQDSRKDMTVDEILVRM
ncbi:conserved oligomeric Golgi complex subunit 8 isoform X2 [Lycorma delicatula]|uniref:conserved oligomeric Golgi complex subunit 8 isoform X2 n=1 Tax=Lycorma delicatula TaxID=130591 RepID=UPI003F514E49